MARAASRRRPGAIQAKPQKDGEGSSPRRGFITSEGKETKWARWCGALAFGVLPARQSLDPKSEPMQLVKWNKGSIVLVPRALCSAARALCVRTAGHGPQGMRQGQLGERMGRAAAHRASRQEPRPVHDGGQRRQEVCGGREIRLPDRGGREGLGDCRGRDRPRCARAAVVSPPTTSGRRPRAIPRRLPASIVPGQARRQPTPPRSVLGPAPPGRQRAGPAGRPGFDPVLTSSFFYHYCRSFVTI